MLQNKNIRIIGVPSDLGASRRGVDMGPSALRIANLGTKLKALGYQVEDIGNVPVAVRESLSQTDPKVRFLPEIISFTKEIKDRVYQSLKDGRMPLLNFMPRKRPGWA